MLWPFLTIVAVAAAAGLHWWWRARYQQSQAASREALQKLQQEHERARLQVHTQREALFDSMAEGLLLLDKTGRIQLANRAFTQLFGVQAEIRSRTIMEALRLHELTELVESLGAQRQVLSRELRITRPQERWLQVNGSAVVDGAGQRHGAVLVFHDLTQLKKLERTRQEFVANVSHELRTPLSLIKGYVETLLDGARHDPEVLDKFLATIDRNTERLKLLIEDLLSLSELESGGVQLNLQPVALRPLSEKILADFRERAAARQIQLSARVPDLVAHADPERIEQVLCNLVDNAIKYGRNEGSVCAAARVAESGWIEISVRDDGPGIPAESLERVFERFYRVDKARSREQGGTGLGLSIVKHIVRNHGGRVWAESQPGHGAAFFFTLPQEGGAH